MPVMVSPTKLKHFTSLIKGDQGQNISAIADQALVSLGNFVTSLLLARFLPSFQFGAFVLLFTLMLAFNTAQLSIVNYPLSIMAARVDLREANRVAIAGFTLTALCLIPFSLLLGATAVLLNARELVFPAVCALIAWQMQETARRVLLSRFKYRLALSSDLIGYLGQAFSLWLLIQFHHASLSAVFLVMGATSLASLGLQSTAVLVRLDFRELLSYGAAFWNTGKIALSSNFLNALTVLLFPWLLAFQGKFLSAEFYALTTVLGITNPITLGLGNLLLPQTAKQATVGPRDSTILNGSRLIYLGAALLLPYFCALWLWPEYCLRLFYGLSSPYTSAIWSLRWVVLGYFCAYLAHVAGCILFGLENGNIVLWAQAIGTLVAVPLAIPLSYRWGVAGASLAFAMMQLARTVVIGARMRTATLYHSPVTQTADH